MLNFADEITHCIPIKFRFTFPISSTYFGKLAMFHNDLAIISMLSMLLLFAYLFQFYNVVDCFRFKFSVALLLLDKVAVACMPLCRTAIEYRPFFSASNNVNLIFFIFSFFGFLVFHLFCQNCWFHNDTWSDVIIIYGFYLCQTSTRVYCLPIGQKFTLHLILGFFLSFIFCLFVYSNAFQSESIPIRPIIYPFNRWNFLKWNANDFLRMLYAWMNWNE